MNNTPCIEILTNFDTFPQKISSIKIHDFWICRYDEDGRESLEHGDQDLSDDDAEAYVTNLSYYHLVPFETDLLEWCSQFYIYSWSLNPTIMTQKFYV